MSIKNSRLSLLEFNYVKREIIINDKKNYLQIFN
jgi:hypothetical protein